LKKITMVLGSALGVLLIFSVISYAQDLIRQQDPKAAITKSALEAELQTAGKAMVADASRAAVSTAPEVIVPSQLYSATAYSLHGRTASGQSVTRGLIAADPRVLPLGTRVRLEAGQWSGEYLVADTGGAIKGRKIDIWTPSTREALQFGRRPVKLTVLSFPKRNSTTTTRARVINQPAASAATDATMKK
jgi:3D (Asp-Asp-Asp) domain-containing protein